jgi:hypothetical protein
MRLRECKVVFLLLPLVLSVVLVGFLAGCGAGSGQSEGGQKKKQEGEPEGKTEGKAAGNTEGKAAAKAGGEAARKEPLPEKMAFGTVRAFKDDKRRLSLSPTVNAQGKKPLGFKVRKNAQITFAGKEAELGEIKEGQQAQISYVVKNDVNRAIVVNLFEPEDKSSGGGEKEAEQPSGGDEKAG